MRTALLVCILVFAGMMANLAMAQERQAAFVTLLGTDTLAVERFRYSPEGMRAEVVLRTPRTTVQQYQLQFDGAGGLRRYEAVVRQPGAPVDAAPIRREVATVVGDSLRYSVTSAEGTQTRMLAGNAQALPFIDMVHWPFDLMLARAHASKQDSVSQQLFTGRGFQAFGVRRAGNGRMTVVHPYRGTMDVEVDAEGRLVRLDAAGTTRKLIVRRVPEVDIEAIARRFAALDAAGKSFGPLSGRGEAVAQVKGATIRVDYGQPAKRGRTIFGQLVPWGQHWRTGANEATHFETDQPLNLGGLALPAGRYTLFTIPERDGGTLVISRQTGQNGNAYDSKHDFGRVKMNIATLEEPVELFTIRVDETATGGLLQLQWDTTAFQVPFTVGK